MAEMNLGAVVFRCGIATDFRHKTSDGLADMCHFEPPPPPAISETKEARTIKLCTVIAYYIASIAKQLKFLNPIVQLFVAIVLLCA